MLPLSRRTQRGPKVEAHCLKSKFNQPFPVACFIIVTFHLDFQVVCNGSWRRLLLFFVHPTIFRKSVEKCSSQDVWLPRQNAIVCGRGAFLGEKRTPWTCYWACMAIRGTPTFNPVNCCGGHANNFQQSCAETETAIPSNLHLP